MLNMVNVIYYIATLRQPQKVGFFSICCGEPVALRIYTKQSCEFHDGCLWGNLALLKCVLQDLHFFKMCFVHKGQPFSMGKTDQSKSLQSIILFQIAPLALFLVQNRFMSATFKENWMCRENNACFCLLIAIKT